MERLLGETCVNVSGFVYGVWIWCVVRRERERERDREGREVISEGKRGGERQ